MCLLTENHMKRGSVKSACFYLRARDHNNGKQSGVSPETENVAAEGLLRVDQESFVRAHLASRSCSVFLVLSKKLLNEGQQHSISCHVRKKQSEKLMCNSQGGQ